MSLVAGQVIEQKYRIVRVLGVGGMGAVYEGENTRIHRRVAIKVLHAQVASKADIVQRFEREAQAAGRIGSEHIVEVLDLGNLPGGERFMVMEYLDGEALTNRIKVRGRLTPAQVTPILRQLLEGLAAAHTAGIVHRDLKPDNVYLVRRGGQDFVKILDFGVSKFSGAEQEFSMTRTGAVMGTPFYMSPEQARGQKIDHRSDLYSVGVVAYQAVAGRVPFHAETFNELIFKIALETPEPIETLIPGFDAGFAAIIRKAMARDPAHRFQTAFEFIGALDAWANGALALEPSYGGVSSGAPHQAPQQHGAGGFGASQGGPLGTSHPGLGRSGAFGPAALGQSGSSAVSQSAGHSAPLGQSRAFGQSGSMGRSGALGPPGGLGQSGAPILVTGQSQIGLSVTTREPKRTPLVAALAVMAVLGIGGGVAAFKLGVFGGSQAKATSATSPETPAQSAPAETATPAATDAPPASATESPAPSQEPVADGVGSASADTEPDASARPIAKTGGPRPYRPGPRRDPKAPATAAPQQPPPSTGAGRAIGTDL